MILPMKIAILVDEEEVIRKVNTSVLGRLGYTCFGFSCTRETSECFQPIKPDLIICDITVPGLYTPEFDFLSHFRKVLPDTRKILTSRFPVYSDFQELAQTNGIYVLQKPYLPSELEKLVH